MNTFARTALLSLALATTGVVSEASAQSPLFQRLRLMPMNGGQQFDTNRNGRVDAILYDTNRNGRVDAVRMDLNHDGWLETVMLDNNHDGVTDEIFFDTDRNGSLETAFGRDRNTGQFTWVAYDRQGYGYFGGWTTQGRNIYTGSHSSAMDAAINQNLVNRQLPQMYDEIRQSQAAANRNRWP